MMTVEEYNKTFDEYCAELDKHYTKTLYTEFNQFKIQYMESVYAEKCKNADTPAKECICELLEYAIHDSTSGSCIADVDTREVAEEVEEILWEEIGDYLLDSEIYKDAAGDCWLVDVMFGGAYIPYWDGDEWGGWKS